MSQAEISIKDRASVQQLTDKLPHALLIISEAGLDGQGVAEQLAKAKTSEILRITPETGKSNISTEQIRDLTSAIRTRGLNRRVIIINRAEIMTETAQNALLKSLEEPTSDTHFILITAMPGQLLTTIRSRCQTLTLRRTSPVQDAKLLEKAKLTDQEKQQILFLAAGRPQTIKNLSQNPKALKDMQEIAQDAKSLLFAPSSYQSLKIAHKYSQDRAKALELLETLLKILKFQLKSKPNTPDLTDLIYKVTDIESAIKANGNLKLAMLRLAII